MFRFTLLNHMCRDMEAGAGHHAPAGSHPPGREPQPGRRRAPVPQQLRRLPLGHGPDGAGLRVLHLRRRAGPHGLHRRQRAAEVLQQRHTFAFGFRHAGRLAGRTAGARATTHCSAGIRRCRAPAAARSRSARNSARATPSRPARSKRCSSTVCLRAPQDAADRSEITSMASSFRSSGYRLKQAFADAATYCMGN